MKIIEIKDGKRLVQVTEGGRQVRKWISDAPQVAEPKAAPAGRKTATKKG